MTPADRQYRLASPEAGRSLLRRLAERSSLEAESPRRHTRTYLDTFDWRLHRACAILVAESSNQRTTLVLSRGADQRALRTTVSALPAFGEDLASGKLRDFIVPRTGIRRLLSLLEISIESQLVRVLDERRKTVVRLRLEERTVRSPKVRELPPVLKVEPLKGYRREFETVIRELSEESELEEHGIGEQEEALESIGRRPRDYSSKIRVNLVGQAPASGEIRRILLTLLATLVANEEGLRGDLDTEFLHDFRVSVRRTRTALSQIKDVFSTAVLERFKPEFSWLGKLTGPTRDLDVYLLKMKDYRSRLPRAVSGDLEPLRKFLEAHRQVEREKLLEGLDSARFAALVEDWRQYLEQPSGESPEPAGAHRTTIEVATREIKRAYKRLLKRGRSIDAETPATALHRLRIDGKKLRYLLEFFRSLYDQQEMDDLIGALKRLQDNLGDFNDYGVQQAMLSTFGQQMVDEGFTSARALMAMGRLVDKLELGEAAERRRFARRFAEFDSRENRRRYKKLFDSASRKSRG